jgi:hypothetical protein
MKQNIYWDAESSSISQEITAVYDTWKFIAVFTRV